MNNIPLFHFSGHNNDLLVLKQWKGPLDRIMPFLKKSIITSPYALCHYFKEGIGAVSLSNNLLNIPLKNTDLYR